MKLAHRVCAFLLVSALSICVLGSVLPALAATDRAECGRVRIASMNWGSAEVMAAIDRFILHYGFGCEAVLVSGDTMSTFESMTARGEPDVAPEIFVNQFRDELDLAAERGWIDYGARVLTDGSQEGFWIPQYLADAHPEIRTLGDALARPDLFSDESGEGGVMRNCPSGWGCQIMVENLFEANRASQKGFRLETSESSAALDTSIAEAFAGRRGWLGYYWSPTGVLARYPMKRLDFDVAFDREEWLRCTTRPDCTDPKPNAWTPADVYTLVSGRFGQAAPPAAAGYLSRRSWDNETVNRILRWKEENEADGDAAALHFLRSYPAVWRRWLPPAYAERVKDAL